MISKGSFGKADIVADVTYINGEEQERTVISSVTLSDPVAETRARGTKVRPTWYPTGSFRWPCSGRITSYFGYRSTGIRGATSNHKGIDIACSYGTPIYAADGGRVTYAGYKGAMGYVSSSTTTTAMSRITSTTRRCSFPRDRRSTRASRSPRRAAAASPAVSTATSAFRETAATSTRSTI